MEGHQLQLRLGTEARVLPYVAHVALPDFAPLVYQSSACPVNALLSLLPTCSTCPGLALAILPAWMRCARQIQEKKKKQSPHFFKSLLPHPIPTGCMHLDLPICYQDHRPHPSQNLQPVSSPFSSSLSFPFQQTTRFPHLFSLLLSACLPLVEQIPILHLELCDRTNQRNSNEGTDLQALNAEPRMYLRVHADEEAKWGRDGRSRAPVGSEKSETALDQGLKSLPKICVKSIKLRINVVVQSLSCVWLRYADDITLRAESKEQLKSLLMRVKDDKCYETKNRHI